MAIQSPAKHSAHATRVIGRAHDDDRAKPVLVAPAGEHLAFRVGPRCRVGDHLDVRYAEHVQQLDKVLRLGLVMNATTRQLPICRLWRSGKHGDSPGDAAVNEIGSIHGAGRTSPLRHDDDIGWYDGLIDDECAAGGPQNRIADRRHTACHSNQNNHD